MTAARVDALATPRRRLQSIDALRGCVMVIMAIDHVRDFFHAGSQHISPEEFSESGAAVFFTRWITHFSAPVFVLLAGTGAYLSGRRRSTANLSMFLLTRGLWIVALELTVVLLGTTFNLTYSYIILQVMWAIGWSMVVLSVLVHLPWRVLAGLSAVMIAGHNLLDGIAPEQFGAFAWVWQVLHVGPALIPVTGDHTLLLVYPLIPWVGVMSAGYVLGRIFDLPDELRRDRLWRIGLGMTLVFIMIRVVNAYGDPQPWEAQRTALMTVMSFLRTTKYPPSLDYLLMTLGPALMALALLDRVRLAEWNPLVVFGRVPLFYYLTHWYVLHGLAVLAAWLRYGHGEFLFGLPPSAGPISSGYPEDYGYSLPVVYRVWFVVVLALYPLCLWFARLKARRRSAWLSYL